MKAHPIAELFPSDPRRALIDQVTAERFGGPVIRSDRPRHPYTPDTAANRAVRRYLPLTEDEDEE